MQGLRESVANDAAFYLPVDHGRHVWGGRLSTWLDQRNCGDGGHRPGVIHILAVFKYPDPATHRRRVGGANLFSLHYLVDDNHLLCLPDAEPGRATLGRAFVGPAARRLTGTAA